VQGSSQTIEASGDAGICPGGSTQLSVAGGADYTWYPAEGLSNVLIANPVASPLRTTRYYVRSGVAGSCAAIDSVLVTVIDPPSLQVTANTSVCAGNSVTLNASGGLTYEWTPAEGLSDPGVANPVATPDATTVYTVRSTGNGGCSAEASVEVTVTPKGKVYVPNAFTPNGDGLNDCFSVTGAAGATRFELSIYNRLGEKVFATSDPAVCWDGRYKGVLQPSGTFVYYLNMESSCGPAKSKGTVMLIR
jgi:gliding motility-associated-like protein